MLRGSVRGAPGAGGGCFRGLYNHAPMRAMQHLRQRYLSVRVLTSRLGCDPESSLLGGMRGPCSAFVTMHPAARAVRTQAHQPVRAGAALHALRGAELYAPRCHRQGFWLRRVCEAVQEGQAHAAQQVGLQAPCMNDCTGLHVCTPVAPRNTPCCERAPPGLHHTPNDPYAIRCPSYGATLRPTTAGSGA
jgi:hypothetical protein